MIDDSVFKFDLAWHTRISSCVNYFLNGWRSLKKTKLDFVSSSKLQFTALGSQQNPHLLYDPHKALNIWKRVLDGLNLLKTSVSASYGDYKDWVQTALDKYDVCIPEKVLILHRCLWFCPVTSQQLSQFGFDAKNRLGCTKFDCFIQFRGNQQINTIMSLIMMVSINDLKKHTIPKLGIAGDFIFVNTTINNQPS